MSKKLKGRGKRSVGNANGSINGNAKRSKDGCDFNISETLLQQELKDSLKNAWTSNKTKDFELNKSVTLIKDPFNCLIVKNVIHNSSAIEGLTDDLQNLKFMSKNNDLYKFVQSSDLKSKQSSAIEGIRVFLKNQVKPWLEEVTGISLAENVDLFCAKYNYSDYLLCHDDELQGKLCMETLRKSSVLLLFV
jgi:Rps23 Pro-64 3,4-dihydroxylase Tpa1-like proline 4-hydroxylase